MVLTVKKKTLGRIKCGLLAGCVAASLAFCGYVASMYSQPDHTWERVNSESDERMDDAIGFEYNLDLRKVVEVEYKMGIPLREKYSGNEYSYSVIRGSDGAKQSLRIGSYTKSGWPTSTVTIEDKDNDDYIDSVDNDVLGSVYVIRVLGLPAMGFPEYMYDADTAREILTLYNKRFRAFKSKRNINKRIDMHIQGKGPEDTILEFIDPDLGL